MEIKNKFFLFDLDGTLLNSNNEINLSSLNAIKKLQKLNNKTSIATGRNSSLAIDKIKQINANNYSIVCNGSFLYDNSNEKIIRTCDPLQKDFVKKIVHLVKENNANCLVYTEKFNYFFSFNVDPNLKASIFLKDTISIDTYCIKLEKLINDIFLLNPFCFSVFKKDLNMNLILKEMEVYKTEYKMCNMSSGLKDCIDFYNYNVSKYTGYLKLKEILNFSDDDVFYFGDSMNDYEMFKNLKNTIAMGNAVLELKKIAKYQIGDNNSNAIHDFINDLI